MSASFAVTRDDVINAALRLIGALADGATATANDLTNGAQALEILLKKWSDQGYKGWLYRRVGFVFVAGRPSWQIGEALGQQVVEARPHAIAQAWWEDSNQNRQPMVMLTRERFFSLSPANQSGPPTNWYYDPQIPNGVFYTWPIPADTNGTFYISWLRPINDIGSSGTATFDVPQTWFAALKWGLADEVALEYGCDERIMNRIERKAQMALVSASNAEEEEGSVMFTPATQGSR